MAFIGLKEIGNKLMRFNADGSVESVMPGDASAPVPVRITPDEVKPKARRGRKPKASGNIEPPEFW